MPTHHPLRSAAVVLAAAFLIHPAVARAGLFGGRGGGGGGGGGSRSGIGEGALVGAVVGGLASVFSGGSFKEGAKAGAAAAGDPGRSNDVAQAVAAGRNAANQSSQNSHSGPSNPYAGSRPESGENEARPNTPPDQAPAYGRRDDVEDHASVGDRGLTPAQAANLQVTRPLPPAALLGLPGGTPPDATADDDPQYSDQQVQDYLRQQGKGDFAKPGSGTPAPPMPMAGLDSPKRYQVNVPPVPPGVEVKGGQSAANAQNAALKLNADAVNSTFGTTVDLQAIKAPSSLDQVGRRASGEVGGGRVDPRDRERALRATLSAGQSRFGLKDYNGALAEAEAAIEMAPRDPQGYLLYARTLNKLGLHAKAEEMALKARKLSLTAEAQALAQSEVTQALLYQNRVTDALASAAETTRLAQQAGSKGLEANAQFLMAAACQLKNDRNCMVKALERAAYLDAKYYEALDAAKAGKNVFDPNDKESLGLLDSVSGDDVPLPEGLGYVGGGLLAVIAALAGAAGLAWRRSRREAAKHAIAAAMGVKKDDGLLGGKYALGKPVSLEGGGDAWEADDVSLGRRALVVRLSDPAAAEEARRLASVHHPNVVDVFEVLDTDKGQFVVRERLSGRTLRQVLAGRGKMGVSEAKRLLAPVCEALEAARGQSVVSGGLTLSSVMLCDEGYVKVVDLASHPTRGDVQALAACLAELLTGRPHRPDVPIAGASLELSALLSEAASGKIPGPAAFAARLERLGEAVLAG